MKHAYKSFLLENANPVKVCGDESLYALQNTSNSTVTLQGSNNAITWVNVIDIPADTTKHVQSAFAFLKANGELHVNRAQGSLSNPSLLDENGKLVTVSADNPLPINDGYSLNKPIPTFAVNATGQLSEAMLGREWMAEYSCAAVSAKYSKIALYNPVGSGKKITFFNVYGANGATGTVRFTAKKITSVDGMTEIPQTSANSQNLANDNQHTMKVYYSNEDTLSSNFAVSTVSVSTVYPTFGSAMLAIPLIVLNEGEGVLHEANTVNTTMYIRPLFCEFDPVQIV